MINLLECRESFFCTIITKITIFVVIKIENASIFIQIEFE